MGEAGEGNPKGHGEPPLKQRYNLDETTARRLAILMRVSSLGMCEKEKKNKREEKHRGNFFSYWRATSRWIIVPMRLVSTILPCKCCPSMPVPLLPASLLSTETDQPLL